MMINGVSQCHINQDLCSVAFHNQQVFSKNLYNEFQENPTDV